MRSILHQHDHPQSADVTKQRWVEHVPFAKRRRRDVGASFKPVLERGVCPGRVGESSVPSPSMGPLHNSMSLLSQGQIDDAPPFAAPLWIPAYAGMTLVVQSALDGRGLEPAPGLNRG